MNLSLYAVTFDCSDAASLADFWAAALGKPVDADATPEFASIGLNDPPSARPHWMFVQVPEGKRVKNRTHVDLSSPTREDEVKRLIDLGAAHVADRDEGGVQWTTMTDPEGNEFDIIARND